MSTPSQKTSVLADLSGIEIMHYVLRWCYNWSEKDFQLAFKDSHLGWKYHWDKLEGKIENSEMDPTAAIVGVVLNMDEAHLQMLFTYIFEKYAEEIHRAREWKTVLKAMDSDTQAEEQEFPEDPDQLDLFEN